MNFIMITTYDFIPKCMKYTVLFVNIMYWILGVIAVGIGLYVHRYHLLPIRDYITIQVNPIFITSFLGILLFITAIFGFVGALRENLAFMKWYLGTLLLLLMIHAVFGASAFVIMSSNPSISDQAEEKFQRALFTYKDDEHLADFINKVQYSLQCCGIDSFIDWNLNPYFACETDNYSIEKCSVPASCCRLDMMETIDLTCGYGVTRENSISKLKLSTIINTKGCIPRIEDIIQNVAGLLGFFSFAIATSLFFGVILANRVVKILEAEVNKYWKKMESENHVVPYDGYNGFLMPETVDLQKTGHLTSSELEYNLPTSL